MKQKLIDSKRARIQTANPPMISWIEKLLQTPLDDYRKFAVWRILAPYLINIRKYSSDAAFNTIKDWLEERSKVRRLEFSPNYLIKYNIKSAKMNGYLPISLENLKIENKHLHNILTTP